MFIYKGKIVRFYFLHEPVNFTCCIHTYHVTMNTQICDTIRGKTKARAVCLVFSYYSEEDYYIWCMCGCKGHAKPTFYTYYVCIYLEKPSRRSMRCGGHGERDCESRISRIKNYLMISTLIFQAHTPNS